MGKVNDTFEFIKENKEEIAAAGSGVVTAASAIGSLISNDESDES